MLSLPDFKAKQILFLQSFELKELKFKNDNLIIQEEGKTVNQVPCSKIFAVFIIGEMTFTSVLIKKLLSYGIVLYFLQKNFAPYAAIGAETEGNTILRKRQYTNSDALGVAQKIVSNKIQNQRSLIMDLRNKDKSMKDLVGSLRDLSQKAESAETLDILMGFEGAAAKQFFSVYFSELNWHGRKPRTKYDIPNTLLDIGYTYLFNFIDAHLRLYGFDTYHGYLHQLFYQRKSLVCDVVEPFRCVIDRALRKAWNLNQIDPKDFKIKGHQYLLEYKHSWKYTKIFLEAIMEEKEAIFLYIQKFYRSVLKNETIPFFILR